MRIVLAAFGTWGDVRPYGVLGQALQKAGHEVMLLAAEEFRQWVEARGLSFTGLSINMQAVMASMAFDRAHPRASMERMNSLAAPMLQLGREIAAAVHEGDALLISEGVLGLMNGIVEKYKTRLLHVNLQPYAPTREFPSMILPVLPEWMPLRDAYNRSGGRLMRRMTWLMFGSLGNQLRTQDFALPKQTSAKYAALLDTTPSLLLVSRQVIPQPADWLPRHRVTGYLFDEDADWQAPQDLLDFLAAGEKPVYIGFGSMVDRKAEATTRLVLDAVRSNSKRAVLLSGWAGIGTLELPKEVFLLKYAPHSWLFPRMAAVVHHGGAGTTAAGLSAGVPSIVVPFQGDQPFWGKRVYELGVGTKPIPRGKLSADKLAAAIREATSNQTMQAKAAELGQQIAAEDGIGEAVKVVQEFLI